MTQHNKPTPADREAIARAKARQQGIPMEPDTKKFFVQGPEGRKPTRAEAVEMGRQMFDAIAGDRAKNARKN